MCFLCITILYDLYWLWLANKHYQVIASTVDWFVEMGENGLWCCESEILNYMRWNGNDSLLISFKLCFMNGNKSLNCEIRNWLMEWEWVPYWWESRFVRLLWLPWLGYPSGFTSWRQDHLYMVIVRGYVHTSPLGAGMARHHPMVASSRIRLGMLTPLVWYPNGFSSRR